MNLEAESPGGALELTGFEKEKFETIRACPNCPGMMQEDAASYGAEEIQHDWRCDDCGARVSKVFREAATRWFVSRRSDAPVRPRINVDARALQAFEKEKFETTRACPVCPGMLEDRVESHSRTAVVYTWECTKCAGKVTQRFEKQRTLWEPAKAIIA